MSQPIRATQLKIHVSSACSYTWLWLKTICLLGSIPLAMNAGRIIPYGRLVEFAWGYDGGDASQLKTHICHIRQKLGLRPGQPGEIRAVTGVGYSLQGAKTATTGAALVTAGAA